MRQITGKYRIYKKWYGWSIRVEIVTEVGNERYIKLWKKARLEDLIELGIA